MGLYERAQEQRTQISPEEYKSLLRDISPEKNPKQNIKKRAVPGQKKKKNSALKTLAISTLLMTALGLGTSAVQTHFEELQIQNEKNAVYAQLEDRIHSFHYDLQMAHQYNQDNSPKQFPDLAALWYTHSNADIFPENINHVLDETTYHARQVLTTTLPFISTLKEAMQEHETPDIANKLLFPSILVRLESLNGYKYVMSHTGAAGIAQFMPRTAEYFDIHIDETYEKYLDEAIDRRIYGPQAIIYALDGMANETGEHIIDLARNIENIDERFDTEKTLNAMVQKISEDLRRSGNDVYAVLTLYNAGQRFVPAYHEFGHEVLVSSQRFAGFPLATRQYFRDYDLFYQALTSEEDNAAINALYNQDDTFYTELLNEYNDYHDEQFMDLVRIYDFYKQYGDSEAFLAEYQSILEDHTTVLHAQAPTRALTNGLSSLEQHHDEFREYIEALYQDD